MPHSKDYHKKYYLENKQRMLSNVKTRYNNKKEEILTQKKQFYIDNKEAIRKKCNDYYQTPVGHKKTIIRTWKQLGLVDKDMDYIYDTYYLPATNCWVCNKSFDNCKKNMDHDHNTGLFRQILCPSCNCKDTWKKYSEVV